MTPPETRAGNSYVVNFPVPNTATALEELYDLYHRARPLLTLVVLDTAPFVPALRAAAVAAEAAANATGGFGVGQVLPAGVSAGNASAWAAWEASQLAALEGWLRDSAAYQKVVMGHHPLQWGGQRAGQAEVPTDSPGLMRVRALLEQYAVDCYVSGHNGRVERAPSLNGSRTVYVNSGIPTQQQLAAMPDGAAVWPRVNGTVAPGSAAAAAAGYRYDRPGFAAVTADPYRVVVHLFALNGTLLHEFTSNDDGREGSSAGGGGGGTASNSEAAGRRRRRSLLPGGGADSASAVSGRAAGEGAADAPGLLGRLLARRSGSSSRRLALLWR